MIASLDSCTILYYIRQKNGGYQSFDFILFDALRRSFHDQSTIHETRVQIVAHDACLEGQCGYFFNWRDERVKKFLSLDGVYVYIHIHICLTINMCKYNSMLLHGHELLAG